MKQVHLKSISVTLIIVASLFALSGCGAKSAANTNPGATAATTADAAASAATVTQPDPNLMTSQQKAKTIDIKSTNGQQQVDAQIDKNLNNLDKSLDVLDKSLGSL